MAVLDTFTRTVSNGWGTSDSGGVWTTSTLGTGGSAADFAVASGTGRHIHSTINVYRRTMVAAAALLDPDQVVTVTVPAMLTGAALVTGLMARRVDDSNYYWLRAEFNADGAGSIQLKLSKNVAGTITVLASLNGVPGVTYAANTPMKVRGRVVDDTLQIKVWRAADPEPNWQLTVQDASFTAAGGVGTKDWLVGSNTNALPFTVTYDDYSATENVEVVIIDAQVQDVWPPRVLVSVTGLTAGDTVELYRVVGGERTPVRSGTGVAVTDTAFLRIDAELPFGVPVSYIAVVNGTATYITQPATYTLTGGKVAISDAITGNAAEVVVLAWDEKRTDRQATVFRVGGRNVVVAREPGMFTADIEVYVETTSSRDSLASTLDESTEGVVQIRQPGGYDGVDSYLAVLGRSERRWSQDGSDQRRVFTLAVAQVEGWAPALEARGTTLQDIGDAYTGLTLTDLSADYATLLALAQAELP